MNDNFQTSANTYRSLLCEIFAVFMNSRIFRVSEWIIRLLYILANEAVIQKLIFFVFFFLLKSACPPILPPPLLCQKWKKTRDLPIPLPILSRPSAGVPVLGSCGAHFHTCFCNIANKNFARTVRVQRILISPLISNYKEQLEDFCQVYH